MARKREKPEDIVMKLRQVVVLQGQGMSVAEAERQGVPGRVSLRLLITAAVTQQHGFAHAGASFALGDSAAGYAALTLMPEGHEVLTIEMKINLIAPATGTCLIAEGEVIKPGRRISVVRATVHAEDATGLRKPAAILQGTMIPA